MADRGERRRRQCRGAGTDQADEIDAADAALSLDLVGQHEGLDVPGTNRLDFLGDEGLGGETCSLRRRRGEIEHFQRRGLHHAVWA
jgi:hypothetical protein